MWFTNFLPGINKITYICKNKVDFGQKEAYYNLSHKWRFSKKENGNFQMNAKHLGLIIRVNDLDGCRIFYRDLLELGEPLLDSTFACVFQLAEHLTLTLEKSAAEYLEHASAASCLSIAVSDLKAFEEKLDSAGWPLEKEPIRIGVIEYRRGADPEGNPIYFFQDCSNPA